MCGEEWRCICDSSRWSFSAENWNRGLVLLANVWFNEVIEAEKCCTTSFRWGFWVKLIVLINCVMQRGEATNETCNPKSGPKTVLSLRQYKYEFIKKKRERTRRSRGCVCVKEDLIVFNRGDQDPSGISRLALLLFGLMDDSNPFCARAHTLRAAARSTPL